MPRPGGDDEKTALSQLGLDLYVKLVESLEAETELAARNAEARDRALVPEATQVGLDVLAELEVAHAGLQIAPEVVEVHQSSSRARRGTAASGNPRSWERWWARTGNGLMPSGAEDSVAARFRKRYSARWRCPVDWLPPGGAVQASSPFSPVAWVFVAVLTSAARAQTWNEAANVTASNGAQDDRFGGAVAVSSGTAVVGARWGYGSAYKSGTAHVYERDHGGTNAWGEVAWLIAPDGEANDDFGQAVAIDGDTVVVGAFLHRHATAVTGSAYVFQRNQGGPNSWGLVKELTASDEGQDYKFGYSVAVSGDWIAVPHGLYVDARHGCRVLVPA